MARQRSISGYGVKAPRKRVIYIIIGAAVIGALGAGLAIVLRGQLHRRGNETRELTQIWEEQSYNRAFELSAAQLAENPMDYTALVLYGFSAYQLAVAQINNFDTLAYIDDCIWSLRKALLCKEGAAGDPRIYYVLGKAYYYKGGSYADLAVRYLEAARDGGYAAGDIPEYLGLAYAAIHDYRNSVAAFSLALNSAGGEEAGEAPSEPGAAYSLDIVYGQTYAGKPPSDLMLLAIAHSYAALDEFDAARAYLVRCLETSKDVSKRIAARLLLGKMLVKTGDFAAAEGQYLAILEEDGEHAEAHFQMGELYAAAGDDTRARAGWRRAWRINPGHEGARARLNM
ncbi:MAG: hypothetical protein LBD08_02745 [Treponema sp.]|jgi:tetratricopeptide (TPR) repeat protein|nr:hypothetical protein [Treponema sp.]